MGLSPVLSDSTQPIYAEVEGEVVEVTEVGTVRAVEVVVLAGGPRGGKGGQLLGPRRPVARERECCAR